MQQEATGRETDRETFDFPGMVAEQNGLLRLRGVSEPASPGDARASIRKRS
jgi:hypothetical protein